jgi:hypothetical protein
VVFSVFRPNWKIVERGVPHLRQSKFVDLPILIPVVTKPVACIVVPFVGEAYRDSIVLSRSEVFDRPIIQLMRPFSEKESDDLFSANDEFSSITPPALRTVGERN